jgi:hypothetical protein
MSQEHMEGSYWFSELKSLIKKKKWFRIKNIIVQDSSLSRCLCKNAMQYTSRYMVSNK